MWERPQAPEIWYKRLILSLESVAAPLQYTPVKEIRFRQFLREESDVVCIPINDKGDTKDVEISKAKSVYADERGCRWHLHPELVD
jgi:hypothetical protein